MAEDTQHIYPIDIQLIEVRAGLDWLVLELPPRYLPMMPNGTGYVRNILARSGHSVQQLDANIILYHRYHSRRLMEGIAPVVSRTGQQMAADPWDGATITEMDRPEVIEFFRPDLEEVVGTILVARPGAVGISLNGNNLEVSRFVVKALRRHWPEVVIVVGGYNCLYPYVGPALFDDFDYMVIGEAEGSLPALAEALKAGRRPRDLPGIISKQDSPQRRFEPAPLPEDLDATGFPRYEDMDLSMYRTYEDKHLVPITGSRGCMWGRCRFCGEAVRFRKRRPGSVVDEIQFLNENGFEVFHFNESDVNGDPQNLHAIADGIIERGLDVRLMGQLRVSKHNSPEYMRHLRRAGFVHLRFGVDGWSRNTLRLQRKGYNMRLVEENLRNSHDAGIVTTVNIVIGVPGETDEDIDEIVANVTRLKGYIDLVESCNSLILTAGCDYYLNPDEHDIHFRDDPERIYAANRHWVPPDLWYSEGPYIDEDVRTARLGRICQAFFNNGVPVGAFAGGVLRDLGLAVPDRPKSINLVGAAHGYNIVRVDDAYIGIAQWLGPVNLELERLGDRDLWPYVLRAGSKEDAIRAVTDRGASEGDYVICEHADMAVALHRGLGDVQVGSTLFARMDMPPYVYQGRTPDDVRGRLAAPPQE